MNIELIRCQLKYNKAECSAVVVAWKVELLLPTPEVHGLNPISHIIEQFSTNSNFYKTKIRGKKRHGMTFFKS